MCKRCLAGRTSVFVGVHLVYTWHTRGMNPESGLDGIYSTMMFGRSLEVCSPVREAGPGRSHWVERVCAPTLDLLALLPAELLLYALLPVLLLC